MSKKRIAVCGTQVPFQHGGAEILVSTLAKELEKRGFLVEKVLVPFKWYPPQRIPIESLVWRMLDLNEANGERIDLAIATKYPSYAVNHANKITWLVHQFRPVYDLYGSEFNDYGPGNEPERESVRTWVRQFDNKSLSESKRIFSISREVSHRLKQNNGISSDVLYHPPSLHGRYRSGSYEDYVLSVGRLDKLKRTELLIDAMASVDNGIRCKVVGVGSEMSHLRKKAEELNVSHHIDFLGWVTDEELIDLYANAGLVFYAPYEEDYGYVSLEAMFSKKPVLTCFDSGGTLEFVVNGQNGFVVDSDPESIAVAINSCFHSASLLEELGNNGWEMVRHMSWDVVIESLTAGLDRG